MLNLESRTVRGKVKVKVKVALEQTMKVRRGIRGRPIVLLFNLNGRWVWVASATPRPPCFLERLGTHYICDWVGPRAGLEGCGKFPFHRDSIPETSSP
jgi:hypothetical protein